MSERFQSKTVVVYHHPCSDGTAAAWVAKQFFDKVKTPHVMYPADYQASPINAFDCRLFLVDFSYSPEVIRDLEKRGNIIFIIDHHAKAIESLVQAFGDRASKPCTYHEEGDGWMLDTKKCGAMLTWDYFFPYPFNEHMETGGVPSILDYVQDRDLYKRKLPFTDEVTWAIKMHGKTIEEFDALSKLSVDELVGLGKTTYAAVQFFIESILPNVHYMAFDTSSYPALEEFSNPLMLPVIHAPHLLSSDICDEMLKRLNVQIVGSYYMQSNFTYKLSLRSNNKLAGDLAKHLGGSGHLNSSGAYLTRDKVNNALKYAVALLPPELVQSTNE